MDQTVTTLPVPPGETRNPSVRAVGIVPEGERRSRAALYEALLPLSITLGFVLIVSSIGAEDALQRHLLAALAVALFATAGGICGGWQPTRSDLR